MVKSLHTAEYDRLRSLLMSAREKAGLTQTELAVRLARPQSFVAKYEGGERRLDVIEFIQICSALQTDPLILMRKLKSRAGK